ncbi:MAG: ABC transporter permease [Imperialibacter sp.]|uniref:ABC transporter permease n=1 Tax=Imperialibacter sp. TaxID=2038411 RepID=UPI0032EE8FC2
MSSQPPKLPLKFFRWFCHPDYREDIEGDLVERFEKRVEENGDKKAKWLFALEVVRLFRPGIVKSIEGSSRMNQYGMFKNYFKVSWRNMLRQKLYAGINIGGLTIGLLCFLLIFTYVQHELFYDKFFPNADNIYRIYQRQSGNSSLGTDLYAVTPAALPSAMVREYPEVVNATSLTDYSVLLEAEDNENYLESCLLVDEQYFNVFQYEFIGGNPHTALRNAESIVLTESLAKKMFDDVEAMGQPITYWGHHAIVTGVIKDPPKNASIRFSVLVSLHASSYYLEEVKKEKWNGNSYQTFFSLTPGANPVLLQEKLIKLVNERWLHQATIPNEYIVQSLSDIHLGPNMNEELALKGNAAQLMLFSVVSLLVLILACFNYMNLAIARSVNRAKEVGLRKVIGANKNQLILQFLSESVMMALLALVLAVGLAVFLVPLFGNMVERPLELITNENWRVIPVMVGLVMLVGVFSGSYPALFVSSLRPVQALKGKPGSLSSGRRFQTAMVVAQYAVSIAMIICSVVIYNQFRFIVQKDMGFEKEHVITFRAPGNNFNKVMPLLKSELLQRPDMLGITGSNHLPDDIGSSTFLFNDRTGGPIYRLRTDYDFLDLYGIELVAGRSFSPEYAMDSETNYIINETAASALGWSPAEAIGNQFTNEDGDTKTVIGVVKDFHTQSLHLPIAPLMIKVSDQVNYVSVKVRPDNLQKTISELEKVVSQYTDYPFSYQFFDDHFDQLYKDDKRQGELFGFFTILAILISSIGLFGLAAFSAGQRMKEIGIRKILGASIRNIMVTFSISFLGFVLMGFFIAIPIAWFLADRWLQGFAYRTGLEWWVFAATGLAAMLLAFVTVSAQSVQAALANPVNCLRDE